MSADLHTRATDRCGDSKDAIPIRPKPCVMNDRTMIVPRPTLRRRLRARLIRLWAFLCGDVG